jgi:hypothetical protein
MVLIEAYFYVFIAYTLKTGRNIRMQKHSSYVYLKIGRLSWAFMAPLGTCAL